MDLPNKDAVCVALANYMETKYAHKVRNYIFAIKQVCGVDEYIFDVYQQACQPKKMPFALSPGAKPFVPRTARLLFPGEADFETKPSATQIVLNKTLQETAVGHADDAVDGDSNTADVITGPPKSHELRTQDAATNDDSDKSRIANTLTMSSNETVKSPDDDVSQDQTFLKSSLIRLAEEVEAPTIANQTPTETTQVLLSTGVNASVLVLVLKNPSKRFAQIKNRLKRVARKRRIPRKQRAKIFERAKFSAN